MRNVSSVYLSKHCSSLYCQLNKGTTRDVPFVSPDIDSGVAQLDTSVENGSESECPAEFKTGASTSGKVLCAGTVTHSYRIREIAWIDTDLANATQYPLSEFPSIVALQGKTFNLSFAFISFKGSLTKGCLGHYTAYCRRAPCMWELYDDLANGVKTVSEKTKIHSHAALYRLRTVAMNVWGESFENYRSKANSFMPSFNIPDEK